MVKFLPRSSGLVISPKTRADEKVTNRKRIRYLTPIKTEYTGERVLFVKIMDPRNAAIVTIKISGYKKLFLKSLSGLFSFIIKSQAFAGLIIIFMRLWYKNLKSIKFRF